MASSTIPSAFGNPGPRYRTLLTVPPGPPRFTDGGGEPPFHVATGRGVSPRRQQRRLRLDACRNILVVKLDFIGDWVLTTPFLEALRRAAPRARITAVVIDRVFQQAMACPFIDRVVSLSHATGRVTCFGADSPAVLAAFRRDYLGRHFDLAVVPRWDLDFNGALQVAHGSGAPRIVGFSERATPAKAVANRGEDRFYTDLADDRRLVHEVVHNFALLEVMGVHADPGPVSFHFSPADADSADAFMKRTGIRDGGFLVVAPFASMARKRWPPERLGAVARAVAERFGLAIVIVGSPADRAAAAAMMPSFGPRAHSAIDLLGPRQAGALIGRAAVLIGMDSGPAHVAAAVGTPVLVLSCHPADGSPQHPQSPVRFAPWGPASRILVLQPEHAASPCAEGCAADEAHCILGLSVERVRAAALAFVREALAARQPVVRTARAGA